MDVATAAAVVNIGDGSLNRLHPNNGGTHNFAANANRKVAERFGISNSGAAMQSAIFGGTVRRALGHDDVATIRLGMSGLDIVSGTNDDYSFQLDFVGLDDTADIVIRRSAIPEPAKTDWTLGLLSGNHWVITSHVIFFDLDFPWFFSSLWVAFDHAGQEDGTFDFPFNTLAEAVAAAGNEGNTVRIQSGTTDEIITISAAVILEAVGGTVRIGDPSGGARRSSFAQETTRSKSTRNAQSGPRSSGGRGQTRSRITVYGTQTDAGQPRRSAEAEIDALGEHLQDQRIFEHVIPFPTAEQAQIAVNYDSTLSLRLRAETAIDPESLWVSIPGYTEEEVDVYWHYAREDSPQDLWVIFQPRPWWKLEDEITIRVGARTSSDEEIQSRAYAFVVESFQEQLGTSSEVTNFVPQPAAILETEESSSAHLLHLAEPIENLTATTSGPFEIVPVQAFESPRRVWVPLAPNVGYDDVGLYYYYHGEADSYGNIELEGWYQAENVESFLVPGSELSLEFEGSRYLGFLVRHAGIIQLALPE